MGKRETKKFGGDRVGFGVVKSGKTRDEKGEVGRMVVLDAEVVDHQD